MHHLVRLYIISQVNDIESNHLDIQPPIISTNLEFPYSANRLQKIFEKRTMIFLYIRKTKKDIHCQYSKIEYFCNGN